ncbi:MAG: thioredoxin-dependent thiol peroxidase [Pseudanabaena sp.]|jgi:peroxiredoxin Q/BCP|nr:thioredoxin-dependent thiol peroxidase [Pseudanabaena sp. M090S1SP2A07QC]MCA6506671.1 thioredoxin-dependent thiol peroxidase [Pseudanabaena sp. M172S2SP2A07QC]MCA6522855.1 thioredoxin-dependent thiol peroxidase [Pseudanabaena sp. M051S1SP2A07QC]MCA6526986.1 thioredoxin-dependent thiol peroxidase [Pseudanabaena sp. M179S2SP2A07QC]MCA6529659.1 thioredoxin-dependent thiol peroxidase [Pseudanabaena sp. M125S2SP2A07QC]MCA6535926.1 thioredoxin-dependent thiol peroxidase [Pseudanabaena sp. M176S2S
MALNVGDIAPDFSVADTSGNIVTLSSLQGKRVVLYFYPRDNTPGCTKEACGFRDNYAQFQAKNTLIFGVSTDDAKSHQKFTEKFDLPFPLLCDVDAQVATAYESYGKKQMMGKEYMGIFRNTFVIDSEGKIEKIYLAVKAELHPAEVLADI